MDVLVIIPTLNEVDSLPKLVPRVLEHPGYRVLVVDDASSDGTGEVAEELGRIHRGRVEVLHRSGPRGLGVSYIDGMQRALASGARFVCQMDADLSHDPDDLPRLVAAAADHDLVVGSRYLRGISVVNWPLRRVLLSTLANRYVRVVAGMPLRDCTSGYRCWRREGLAKIPLDGIRSRGYSFLVETLYEAFASGCRVTEVPIIFIERREGASKMSGGVVLEAALTPWRLRLRGLVRRWPGAAGFF